MAEITFEKIDPEKPRHLAPQDCSSQKGERCDICFGPMPVVAQPEHPAARAARMVRELHEQNVTLIDSGHKFTKDGEDVSQRMRAASVEQMALCDEIIKRAATMPPELFHSATNILKEMELEIAKFAPTKATTEEPAIPEMGNYDHKA